MRAAIFLSISALCVVSFMVPADAKCSRKGGKACRSAVSRTSTAPAARPVAAPQPSQPKPHQIISPVS